MDNKADKLLTLLAECKSAAVAFSGGVDSSLLALAAYKALGGRAVAVTTTSPTLPRSELDGARRIAREIGIQQVERWLDETAVPEFAANGDDRCYHCKKCRLDDLCRWAGDAGHAWVLEGSNADDLSDWRPGMKALAEYPAVRSPFLECGFTKQDIRALAKAWRLPVWDKPSSPCLASRIAYGLPVTRERLRMVEEAEKIVGEYCAGNIRVRCHQDTARIETDADNIARLAGRPVAGEIAARLKAVGFTFVALDLTGFVSGSMNTGRNLTDH